jgi:molecular chaperone Hsp33
MTDSDSLSRFLFEHTGIRGNLVHLDASWRAVLATHAYPDSVRGPLGESLAAVALLAATIKFDGSLILQAQGAGPLCTLVAQATHERTVRGLATWVDDVPATGELADLFGPGRLVLTIKRRQGEPYQGIVPLEGGNLSAAIERYFSDSEQLPTRLWLAATGQRAAGLLLQRLPRDSLGNEDWERICLLADTLTPAELIDLPGGRLLYRLFHEEPVRLFEPDPLAFRCGCSRARIEEVIRLLGEVEANEILAEQGVIQVNCEFCNREYRLDRVDARQLFAEHTHHAPPVSRQ